MAPADRQKRARRAGSDGDRSPVYAESAPFRQSSTTPADINTSSAFDAHRKDRESSFEGWLYMSADENELKNKSVSVRDRSPTRLSRGSASSFTFKNEGDAATFDNARPPWDTPVIGEPKADEQDSAISGDESKDVDDLEAPSKQSGSRSHKMKSSLSALAKPFEFSPQLSSPQVTSSFNTPRKPQGLESSRFAAPARAPEMPVVLTANLSSPPPDLDHYVERDSESQSEVEVEVETPSDAEAKAPSVSSAPSPLSIKLRIWRETR